MRDFIELAESRRSCHDFLYTPVDFEIIINMIRAASFAPSVGDLQPWKFIVITDKGSIKKLTGCCPRQGWVANASAVIVVLCEVRKAVEFYGEPGKEWAIQSCAAATQNLLLGAEYYNIGACWVGSFDKDMVRDQLKIPDSTMPEAIIAIGKRHGTPNDKTTKPLDKLVYFGKYGTKAVDSSAATMDYGEFMRKRHKEFKEKVDIHKHKAKEGYADKLHPKVKEHVDKVKKFFKK